MSTVGPGIYLLHNIIYDNISKSPVYKVGSSLDVGTRINSSDYRTILLPEHRPKYLGSVHPIGYSSQKEIVFLEKVVHNYMKDLRIANNRELFYNVTLEGIINILDYLGIDHEVVRDNIKPRMSELELNINEYEISSFEDISIRDKLLGNGKDIIIVENNVIVQDIIKAENILKVEPTIKFNINLDSLSSIIIKPETIENINSWKPLHFQIPIIDKLYQHYIEGNDKGTIIIPCSYGKSYIALFLIRKMLTSLNIIFVPTVILSEQFEEISTKVLTEYIIIRFCGDTDKNKNYIDIYNNLNKNNKIVIICTYDSADQLYILFNQMKRYPDFNIYDEAHRTAILSKSIDEESKHRDIIFLQSRFKLFMTATQKIITSTVKKVKVEEVIDSDDEDNNNEEYETDEDLENSDVSNYQDLPEDKINNSNEADCEEVEEVEEILDYISMDNEQYYGKVVVNVDFSEAIENGYISDYRFVCVNSGDPVEVIKRVINQLNIQHMITYHSTVNSAKELTNKLNEIGIKSFTIDGKTSSKNRREILKQFEETPNSVLTSCKVLSEGISLNYVDSVYFVDPKSSKIDIIQSFCRCLRLYKNKTLATIIIENDIEKYADVLKNIVLLDKRLKSNKNKMFINVGFNKESIIKNKQEVSYEILGRNECNWMNKYNLCLQYEKIYNKNIVKNTIYKDVKIGSWINTQKERYKGKIKQLEEFELSLLSKLNTFKNWLDTRILDNDFKWIENYNICVKYEHFTYKNIISTTKDENSQVNIGYWLDTQKKRYKSNGKPLLEKQINLLLKLNTIKEWLNKNISDKDEKWTKNYESCILYENKYNKNITHITICEDSKLKIGNWFHTQKKRYENKEGRNSLDEKKIKLLLNLQSFSTWIKSTKLTKIKWIDSYDICYKYEQEYKTNITQSTKYSNVNIGTWIDNQKKRYKGKGRKIESSELELLLNLNTFKMWITNSGGVKI